LDAVNNLPNSSTIFRTLEYLTSARRPAHQQSHPKYPGSSYHQIQRFRVLLFILGSQFRQLQTKHRRRDVRFFTNSAIS
jgi:hypothetical protein